MRRFNINVLLIALIFVALSGILAIFKYNSDKKVEATFPKYVSIKSSNANVRSGPGRDYPIIWSYEKKYVPIKALEEYHGWYKIEDSDGSVGWIYKNLTSEKRFYIVVEDDKIYDRQSENSKVIATISKNAVVSSVDKCDGEYCKIKVQNYSGWLKKDKIWGYDPSK